LSRADAIPIVETYRGVGIHDAQPRRRIEEVVKPAIDVVLALEDVHALARIAEDVSRPPEARLLAAAKVEAAFSLAAEARWTRPLIDLARVKACVAGLGSQNWRDPWFYTSLLDSSPAGPELRVRRETPLPIDERG
jgi:hypothetical protein